MPSAARHIVHHIPVCPFSQRLEILLALRGQPDLVDFRVVDITRPRDPALLALTGGSTALPVMETPQGRVLKESLVILRYLDEAAPGRRLRRSDPAEHAVENMLVALEGAFAMAGYRLVMNQDADARAALRETLLGVFRQIDAHLVRYGGAGPWLFEDFGLAEAVFTPLFMRFWFLEYYEDFDLPDDPSFARVRTWRDASLAHPAAQQVSREEIVKLYYDYALGAGNGALVAGRAVSSFAFDPPWAARPWPPRDKFAGTASDAELGLLA